MIHPPAIAPGDRIAVVSPAGPVTPDLLEPGLERLRAWGLEVEIDDAVYARSAERGYLAGSDRRRLEALQRALDVPQIDAVVFSRGGYGTMRLLPELDFGAFRDDPALLVGFSDLTALHLHVAGNLGVATLHGPVVKSLGLHETDDPTGRQLRTAMMGPRSAPLGWNDLETIRGGQASGRFLGGNLTVLASMLPSPWCPDLSDCIVLLEETGEEDYRLDRKLTGLRLASKMGSPAGIVLGDITGGGGAYFDDEEVDELAESLVAEFDCPVVADAPVGHETPNLPCPLGVEAELDADAGELRFASDAARPTDSDDR